MTNLPAATLGLGYKSAGTHTLESLTGGPAMQITRPSAAVVVDYQGQHWVVGDNEARFPGARRGENLVPFSEDLTLVGWVEASGAVIVDHETVTYDGTANGRKQNRRVEVHFFIPIP